MPKIKSEWVEMRVNGWLAWIHRAVMFITFPIRRFWQIVLGIIVICILLALIPLYYGVGFTHITHWYREMMTSEELKEVKEQAKNTISGSIEAIKDAIPEPDDIQPKETHRFAVWNVPEFKKAKYHPKSAPKAKDGSESDTKKAFLALAKAAREKAEEIRNAANNESVKKVLISADAANDINILNLDKSYYYSGAVKDYYKILPNLNLAYLSEPETLYGKAEVIGPNSLSVNNTFMFLYGIYSDEEEYDVAAAEAYLRDVTANQPILCEIVAYAVPTRTATALCFSNGIFINKSMVNHDLAQNVALK